LRALEILDTAPEIAYDASIICGGKPYFALSHLRSSSMKLISATEQLQIWAASAAISRDHAFSAPVQRNRRYTAITEPVISKTAETNPFSESVNGSPFMFIPNRLAIRVGGRNRAAMTDRKCNR